MPVRRVPGGKNATVYALKVDLDRWLAETQVESKQNQFATELEHVGSGLRLPGAPEADALFIAARDHWAQRTSDSIMIAIREFEQLIAIAPDFAAAHVGLAEARMVASDYGALPEEVTYGSAASLVRRALELDPNLVDAHRSLGVIAYWWEHDPALAAKHFRRAIEIRASDVQTRFWLAGTLADNGEFDAAREHYEFVRLHQPGSVPLQTHLALLRWHMGEREQGLAELESITRHNPLFPLAWYFLGLARLGDGDAEGFLLTVRKRAEMRGEPQQMAMAEEFVLAWQEGGRTSLMRTAAMRHMEIEARRPYPDHAFAACHAGQADDRNLLLDILRRADRNRERWGAFSLVMRLKARFADDQEVLELLGRRASPRLQV